MTRITMPEVVMLAVSACAGSPMYITSMSDAQLIEVSSEQLYAAYSW